MAMIVSAYGWEEQSFLDSSSVPPSIHIATIASAPVITSKVSTMVLSETHAASAAWPDAFSGHPRGPMVRRVPRRDSCRAKRTCWDSPSNLRPGCD